MGKSSKAKAKQKQKALNTKPSRNEAETTLPKAAPIPPAAKVDVQPAPTIDLGRRRVVAAAPKLETPTTPPAQAEANTGYVIYTKYDNGNPMWSQIQVGSDQRLLQYHRKTDETVFPVGTKVAFDTYQWGTMTACKNCKAVPPSNRVEELLNTLNAKTKLKQVTFGDLLRLAVYENKDIAELTKNIVGSHEGLYYV